MNKEKEVAKKITVIIPCYNAEAYIEQCIESVLHQTIGMENIQMILIDDASTDHTLEYLMKYEQQYPDDILLWVLEANEGQANARNIGIEHTETEYLAFLDADDWLEEDTYEKLIDAAERTGADLVQAGHAEVFEGIQQGEKVLCEAETLYALAIVEERKSFLREHGLSSIWSGVYRTELFSNPELRFANFRKYEDNYFSGLLIFEIKSYCQLPDILYNYRLLHGSNSHARNDEGHFVRLEVELEKLKYYQTHGLWETYYKVIRNNFLDMFYINTIHIIFTKFDEIPIERIHVMQVIVRKFFPDYLEYYKEAGMNVYIVLTVAFDLPLEKWKELKDAYHDARVYGAYRLAGWINDMETALNL